MAKLSGSEIKAKAIEIIKQHPEGIGPTKLRDIIIGRHPETKDGTIRGAVWKLDQDFPALIGKGPNGYYIKGSKKPAAYPEGYGVANKASKKVAAKREKAPAKKPAAKGRDQSAEMAELQAKLAKVQKTVCG